MPTNNLLNLTPLYQRRVFRSHRKVDSHEQVARELADHDLIWRGEAVDTELCKADIDQLQIMTLQYGAEVIVRPRPFQGFALMQMILSGGVEFESDRRKVCMSVGDTALIAPKKDIRMSWQPNSRLLILKIPHTLLREVHPPKRSDDIAVDLPPVFVLPNSVSAYWNILMQSLLSSLSLPGGGTATHGQWIAHFERSVAAFLLEQLSPQGMAAHTAQAMDAPHAPLSGSVPADIDRKLEMLERYMRNKLSAPVSLLDLARSIGVSARALNLICHRHHGASPMDILRNLRLDAAHERLQQSGDTNVTETAFEFGFGHLGRFSAYYNHRFGELPRETLTKRH
jgi:AraC-like DNA-binding protein